MGFLDQFFRLREPAWSGRVVTLGALAARCPVPVERANPAAERELAVISPLAESAPTAEPTPAAVTQPVAEASPPETAPPTPPPRRLRKTGDASVIAPQLRTLQTAPAPMDDDPMPPPAAAAESAAAPIAESRGELAEIDPRTETEPTVEISEVTAPVKTDEVDGAGARGSTAAEPDISPEPSSNGTANLESPPSLPDETPPPDSPSMPAGSETPRSSRRSGPCLDDPTLPPLQLRAQIESQVAEIRPLVLGQPPAEMTTPQAMELRQITPPPVRSAPVHAPALDANGAETEAAAEEPTDPNESPAPEPAVWHLEIVAGPDFDAPGLLAQIQALPGVIESGWRPPTPEDATH